VRACPPLPAPLLSSPKPSTNRRCAFVCCIPIDVYFRKEDIQVKNKPTELEKIIKYLTNEDFEDYTGKQFKRRLNNPDNFEIVDTYPKPSDLVDSGDETDKFTCICSENTCNHLIIIWHKPTNTYMAVGSIC
jgi:hypothetical protein